MRQGESSRRKQAAESTEERLKRGPVVFPFWTRGDEVGMWSALAMFLGFCIWAALAMFRGSSLFGFLTVGENAAYALFMLPIWFLILGFSWRMRKSRVGRSIVLDHEGIQLDVKGSRVISIDWDDLDGLVKAKIGVEILARNGTVVMIPLASGRRRAPDPLRDIIEYVVSRSRWIDERRYLIPEPPSKSRLRILKICWGSLGIATTVVFFGYMLRAMPSSEMEATIQVQTVTNVTAAGIIWGVAVFFAARTWHQAALRKHPHLWDLDSSPPPYIEIYANRIQPDLRSARSKEGSQLIADIPTILTNRTWLTRTWTVEIHGQNYEIFYNGRGPGFEEVRVDGRVACRTPSYIWYVPRFDFLVGNELSVLEVRVNALFRVRACKLTISGKVRYTAGRI